MSEKGQQEVVRFSTTGAAVAGALAGVAIAIGVPWVILAFGQVLGAHTQLILVWVGVIMGGLISLTSAFFGLVMPSQVGHNPSELMAQWEQWERVRKKDQGEASR
jgi:hypothetical protein